VLLLVWLDCCFAFCTGVNTMAKKNYFVTSYFQTGGITAGEVNIGVQPRSLDDEGRNFLQQIPKNRAIEITALMGDGEACAFAEEIWQHLGSEGYKVDPAGINMAIWSTTPKGVLVNIKSEPVKITVGRNSPR
jgi:hypothetical protein